MRIVIIGAGNIATFFGKKFHAAGYEILQVISAHATHAKDLAAHFHCAYSDAMSDLRTDADVYLFAVKDDVLLEFARHMTLPGKLLIHTAGAVQLHELQSITGQVACIWPVYSISKDHLPAHEQIPLVVNAADDAVLRSATYLAKAISEEVFNLDDVQKSGLHLAAVFANNFTNHLYTISKQIAEERHIPFRILLPLIRDTATKLNDHDPEQSQTGPAIRHDHKTMEKHMQLLNNVHYEELYKLLSDSIQRNNPVR